MAAGIEALGKAQLGRETTAGTAVAATTIWRGKVTLEDTRELALVEENVGIIGGTDNSYIPKLGAKISVESVEATFEQVAHIFEMGIMTASPAADGSGYVRTYDFPTTQTQAIKTYTMEVGDNIRVQEAEYCYAEGFKLTGKAGESLKVSADVIGRQVTVSAFTTTATLPTTENVLFSKGKLYIDPVSGTQGTTQITETLLEMSLDVKTGLVGVFTADGNLYFTFVKNIAPEITLEITFEHNASATAQIDDWRTQTPKLIQLKFEGAALSTAGSGYSNKTLLINLAGKWKKFGELSASDGNNTVKGTFVARYNATAAKFASMVVVNEVSALP